MDPETPTTSSAESEPERRIRQLPSEVVQLIAAGEVIHRPFNVVKELVENCIDAGSSTVIVSLKSGGFDEIVVRDDGKGIFPEDAEQIARRFHSSKLQSLSDVYQVRTLGFRGEALSSMALMGRVNIASRVRGRDDGVIIDVCKGERTIATGHNLDPGTTVTVSGLFSTFTTSEVSRSLYRITSLVTDYALARHDVKFVLSTPKPAFSSPSLPQSSLFSETNWISAIFGGKQVVAGAVDSKQPPFSAGLFAVELKSTTSVGKASGKLGFTTMVNNRLVTVAALETIIKNQMDRNSLVAQHIVVFLRIDAALVDVHVSPTKQFVKLRNADDVFEVINREFEEMIQRKFSENVISTPKSLSDYRPSQSFSVVKTSLVKDSPSQMTRLDSSQPLISHYFKDVLPTATGESPNVSLSLTPGNGVAAAPRMAPHELEGEHVYRTDYFDIRKPLYADVCSTADKLWTERFRKCQALDVGFVDGDVVLGMQHNVEFFVAPFAPIIEEYFYQRLIDGLGNFACIKLLDDASISLRSVLLAGCRKASPAFVKHKMDIVRDSRAALSDIFSITMISDPEEDDFHLTGTPIIVPNYSVSFVDVALSLVQLETGFPSDKVQRVTWVQRVSSLLAAAYAAPATESDGSATDDDQALIANQWSTIVLPHMKALYLPGAAMMNNVFAGSNASLYRCFERC